MTLPFADSNPLLMLHILDVPALAIGLFLFLSLSFFVSVFLSSLLPISLPKSLFICPA